MQVLKDQDVECEKDNQEETKDNEKGTFQKNILCM